MRYLLILLITITYLQLSAQRYYSKTYDPYNHQEENIRNLIATDSMIYLSCRGGCEGNTIECFKYARVDIEGNYIDGYEDTRFETGYGMETDGEWIYVDGGNEPYITSFFANKISFSGDTNTLLELQMDPLTQNWFNNISSTINEEYFITYGGFYDLMDSIESKPKFKAILNWINLETFSLDTAIILNPIHLSQVIIDAKVDKNDNVYFALEEIIPNSVGNNIKYVRIIKMDNEGNVLWDYLYDEGYTDFNSIEIVIIDGKVIFTQVGMYNVEELVCIDSMGKTLWKNIFDDDANTKDYLVTHLEPLNSMEFLAVGVIRSGYNGWSDVGYLSKFTVDGEQLWERVFEVDKGVDLDPYYSNYYEDRPLSKAGVFYNVEELKNGDLVCVGELKKGYDNPESGLTTDQDLWIVKTDSMGCIVPGCGFVQTIKNGVVVKDTCKWLKDGAEWYYTPWSFPCSESISKVEIIGDTLVGNRVCSILGVIENDKIVEGSELIVFYEWASEHVYFYEDEQWKLLFDFSLGIEPGDTVAYFLPQNFAKFDISSSSNSPISPSKNKQFVRYLGFDYIKLPDSSWLRTIITSPIYNEFDECFELGEIVSGIGSKHGILGRYCDQAISGCEEKFRCFNSNTLNYSEVEGKCDTIISSVDNFGSIKKNIFTILPNPSIGIIDIITSHKFVKMILLDTNGRIISSAPYTNQIDIQDFSSGLYILKLIDKEGRVYSTKLVKE